MKFLGEQCNKLPCNKFPCPDSKTEKKCPGDLEIMIEAYRVMRGHGAFVLVVPERVQCNECGRVFKIVTFSSKAENHFFFNPV